MSLLNYTTQITVEKSIAEISRSLSRVGARKIMHEYDENGFIISLSFEIILDGQPIGFRLTTDWRPVLKVLENDTKVPRAFKNQEQALRVAWRITKDWVEAQAAYIETMIVTTTQVFLPYAIASDGKTFYQTVVENPQMLLGKGRDE